MTTHHPRAGWFTKRFPAHLSGTPGGPVCIEAFRLVAQHARVRLVTEPTWTVSADGAWFVGSALAVKLPTGRRSHAEHLAAANAAARLHASLASAPQPLKGHP